MYSSERLEPDSAYNSAVEEFQKTEYPMLQEKHYLDHGGTTIYATSMIETFAKALVTNLYGNPHSASTPSKLSGQLVDDTRKKTLKFFGADPEHFELIFVANATAAIKLVMETFRDIGDSTKSTEGDGGGFWYGYHLDSHNSIVGVRESCNSFHRCFRTDSEVENWLSGSSPQKEIGKLGLFAYPGQSNMNGRRLPLTWPGLLRSSAHPSHQDTYSLLDAAALATTYPLNSIFRDHKFAPDFTVLSFYKIFGFPDLGGLIVRKTSGIILQWGRRYFGGGTVSIVTVNGTQPWFKRKEELHSSLEDGTLPFHSIIALDIAIDTHNRLYGSNPMATISKHTCFLGKRLYEEISSLCHPTGIPVCQIYKDKNAVYGDSATQGATIAFNVLSSEGKYYPYTSVVEKLASERHIYVRAGSLCNPGGIATHLGFEPWQIKRLYFFGLRCGEAHETGMEVVNGKPTGVVRVSLGAMTTMANVEALITFLREEFLFQTTHRIIQSKMPQNGCVVRQHNSQNSFQSESENRLVDQRSSEVSVAILPLYAASIPLESSSETNPAIPISNKAAKCLPQKIDDCELNSVMPNLRTDPHGQTEQQVSKLEFAYRSPEGTESIPREEKRRSWRTLWRRSRP